MRIAFAGDRDIAVWCLEYILQQGVKPVALLLTESGKDSHAKELRALCPFLEEKDVIRGNLFRQPEGVLRLRALNLDFIIGVHFPYIVPDEVLSAPQKGVLNLHPAFLPYNRGWHTPSWAILENTPVGATLHFMDAGVDTGDILHQRALEISFADTAHTLYEKLKRLEFQVFQEAWPMLTSGAYERKRQDPRQGSVHKRRDLFESSVQKIDLQNPIPAGDLIRRLRALTTNRIDEAAYFEVNGKRYRIQVNIQEEPEE
jgi:methionyl-tRNA formyltransferase